MVLPGVGSFYDAIAFMQESGEAQAVLDAIGKGTPFLGICLGLQLLFERGDEGVPEDAPAVLAEDAMGSNLAPAEVSRRHPSVGRVAWACFPVRVRVWNRRASKCLMWAGTRCI